MTNVRRPAELFGLNMMPSVLSGFRPPQGTHDPAGPWAFDYQMVSLATQAGVAGEPLGSVRMVRQMLPNNRFTLDIDCRKQVPGEYCARLSGKVTARLAPLPVPQTWSWTSEILSPPPATSPLSQLSHTATLEGGQLKLQASGRLRTIPMADPVTINWLLFEAVGRLPREPFAPLNFTLIDDFDLPKPHHRLHFVETIKLMLGSQTVPLHVYHRLGDSTVPWIYWVDNQGRLLFVVSGLEAYVLNIKNQA